MKSTSVILPFALGASFPLSGADVFKADNGDQLVNDSSWTTTAPTASDVAVFDDTYTQTGNLGTGAALDYLGIRVAGTTVTDGITVNNTSYDNYIGTGASGIDLSVAPRDLKIVGYQVLDNQTWSVAAGRTLDLGGTRFAGTGDIDITGSGTTFLRGDGSGGTYTGEISLSGGTLNLVAEDFDGDLTIGDGTTFIGEPVVFGDTVIGSSTGATIGFDPGTEEVLDTGNLELFGTTTLTSTAPPTTPSVVPVIDYITLVSGGLPNLQIDPALAANFRNAPVLQVGSTGFEIDFVAGNTITWTGSVDADWDVNTTANWDDGGATNFLLLDSVEFDDTGSTFAVNVDGDVPVDAISFNNPVNPYTISGGSLIIGGGVSAAGFADITSPVTFSAPQVLSAASGVELDFSGTIDAGGNEITVDGDGTVSFNDGGSSNQISNGGGIVKNGSGVLIMSGRNNSSGDLTVNEGTVSLINNNWSAPNFGGVATVNSGAVLEAGTQTFGFGGRVVDLYGGTLTLTGAAVYVGTGTGSTCTWDGGTVNVTGSGNIRSRGTFAITGSSPTTVDLGNGWQCYANTTFDVADVTSDDDADFTLSGGSFTENGNRTMVKAGAGTMVLNSGLNITGASSAFNVDAGKLIITSEIDGGSVPFVVADGAGIGGDGGVGGNLTLGTSTGAFFETDISSAEPFDVGGDLTINGITTVSLDGFPHTGGPITLITYGGTLTGDPATQFVLDAGTAANFRSAVFANTGTAITVDLGSEDLVWNSGTWDVNSSTAWNAGASKFFPGDAVSFDDTAASGSVTLDDSLGGIAPSMVTVNNDTVAYSFSGDAISGSGSLLKQGPGTLTLSNAANTYTGGTTIEGGALFLGGSDLLPVGGDLTVTSPGVFDMDGFDQTLGMLDGDGSVLTGGGALTVAGGSFSGVIAESGSLTVSGGIPFVVSGANTYSGGTMIAPATLLRIDDGGALGSGAVVTDGVLAYNLSTDVTVSNLSGAGSLAQEGSATMFITDDSNTYAGDTIVSAGTLRIGDGATSGSIPGGLVNNGTTIFDRSDTVSLPGVTGGGDLVQAGSGNLDVDGSVVSNGNSDYIEWYFDQGTVTVSGRAELHDGGIGAPAPVFHFDGGTLAFDAWPDGSVGGYKQVELSAGGGVMAPASGVSVEFDGNVFGAGAFTKTGDGSIILSAGGNSYTGDTTVDAGILELSNPTLDDAATLNLDGTGVLNLTHAGTDVVGALFFDSVEQATGTWGAIGSGADNETVRITGTGLIEVPSASDYDTWATDNGYWTPGDPDTAPGEDFDGDGVTNEDEYAFGLDPTDPSSVSPITQMLDPVAGTFTYTRRDPALTGYSYAVNTTETLAGWAEDTGASENVLSTVDGVQTVEVTLTATLLNADKLFVQVEATAP